MDEQDCFETKLNMKMRSRNTPKALWLFEMVIQSLRLGCNHSMIQVGGDLWMSSGPDPCSKKEQFRLLSVLPSEYLQGWRSQSVSM